MIITRHSPDSPDSLAVIPFHASRTYSITRFGSGTCSCGRWGRWGTMTELESREPLECPAWITVDGGFGMVRMFCLEIRRPDDWDETIPYILVWFGMDNLSPTDKNSTGSPLRTPNDDYSVEFLLIQVRRLQVLFSVRVIVQIVPTFLPSHQIKVITANLSFRRNVWTVGTWKRTKTNVWW